MFKEARIKLTLWYMLIIMTISLFFSTLVYRNISMELERGYRQATHRRIAEELGIDLPLSGPLNLNIIKPGLDKIVVMQLWQEELLAAKKRVLINLGWLNGMILLFSSLASYYLAGITLLPIKKSMNEQKRFIADASHELRTPLTALKTSIEVTLRDHKLSLKSAKSTLQDSLKDINNLQRLTDNMLKLATHSETGQKILFDPVSVKKIIKQAVKNIKPLSRQKKISIKTNIAKDFTIKGDYLSLVELMTIFLDNSVKYGKQEGWIKIKVTHDKKNLKITIADNGIGISSKDQKHIFERFYRADMARGNNNGYGLGLSVAQKIVNQHRGQIKISSTLDKGTTFSILLPL